jgi:hypothetical protein
MEELSKVILGKEQFSTFYLPSTYKAKIISEKTTRVTTEKTTGNATEKAI